MIAKTTEEFVVNEVLPQLEHLENHEFDRSVALLKQAGELGLLGADVPEEYGGLSLDKISSALIAEKWRALEVSLFRTVRTSESVRFQSSCSEQKSKNKNIYQRLRQAKNCCLCVN